MTDNQTDNLCCPELVVVDCSDTDEHKHLVCGNSKAILTNDTVIKICITDHHKCLLQGGETSKVF